MFRKMANNVGTSKTPKAVCMKGWDFSDESKSGSCVSLPDLSNEKPRLERSLTEQPVSSFQVPKENLETKKEISEESRSSSSSSSSSSEDEFQFSPLSVEALSNQLYGLTQHQKQSLFTYIQNGLKILDIYSEYKKKYENMPLSRSK